MRRSWSNPSRHLARQGRKPGTRIKKQRGGWLAAWLVLMMIHGIFAAFLVLYLREQKSGASPIWVLLVLFALAVVHIVAALAIWEWKRWGLIAYAAATIVSMVVGVILTKGAGCAAGGAAPGASPIRSWQSRTSTRPGA